MGQLEVILVTSVTIIKVSMAASIGHIVAPNETINLKFLAKPSITSTSSNQLKDKSVAC